MRMHHVCAWALVLAACSGARSRTSSPATPVAARSADPALAERNAAPSGRLGDHVVPAAYALEIAVDPGQPVYQGRVLIELRITAPISTVWLHAEALDIRRASLRLPGGDTLALHEQTVPERGLLGLSADRTIVPGAASLAIEFRGSLGTRNGLFRQDVDGASYVFTDFEPIDARRAFPCFDEPRWKTPWTVSLVVPEPLLALSNMPVARTKVVEPGVKRVQFQTTPPLPTYLVAAAVGPFEVVDAPGDAGVPVRVITLRGKAAWARSAASMAPEILRAVADYVASPVPFPKIDLISVPVFDGAMENPGLITVAANLLLIDPARHTLERERFLAVVCAHEFAHLWFGDLVTLAEWRDLWLNEGFATWLADRVLATWDPARGQDIEQTMARADAMAADQHLGARAVRDIGSERAALESAFDAISYKKASAVLAMLEAWVSADTFRRAVQAYLAAHTGKSVTARDFTDALSQAAGQDLGPMLASFLDQPGVPSVRVELRCDGGVARLELSQRRYVLAAERGQDTDERWAVPVCVRFDTGDGQAGRACTMLDRERASLDLGPRCPAWVVPNDGAYGYYRYDVPRAEILALASAPLTEREAVELGHNVRALLHGGDLALADGVTILSALAQRPGRLATEAALQGLEYISDHLLSATERDRFATYVRGLLGKRAHALGLAPRPDESPDDTLLRPALIAFVGRHGKDAALRRATRALAERWLTTGRGVDPSMLGVVLSLAALDGDARLFDRLEAAARRIAGSSDPTSAPHYEHDVPVFAALGSVRRPELVARSLTLIEDPTLGPLRFELSRALLGAPETREQALRFLEERKAVLGRMLGSDIMLLAPLFAPAPCSAAELRRVAAMANAYEGRRDRVLDRLSRVTAAARACDGFRTVHAPSAASLFHPGGPFATP